MDDMAITAEQIKAGRERLHMTQQQLADEVGVSLRTVSSWERGESVPRNRTASVIEVLGLIEDEANLPEFGEAALRRRIGYLAKQRREELGLARIPFARELGMSDRTIKDLELGLRVPYGQTQRKVERGLGWRLGAIEDVMRMKDRKASSIDMESLDAEDSLKIGLAKGETLALSAIPDTDLIEELRRRLITKHASAALPSQELYGLAASSNVEHLEEDED